MTHSYIKRMVVLALMGTLFAGYLSGTKLLTGSCAFNESCPYVFGYPACFFGFFMFAAMLAISVTAVYSASLPTRRTAIINTYISLAGTVFAGYLVTREIIRYMREGEPLSQLGIPTCAYGLTFYIMIFAISLSVIRKRPDAVVV